MAAKTKFVVKLLPNEKKAVREFLAAMNLAYGGVIQSASLFGSKARGDWTQDSDIDIVLVVAGDDHQIRREMIHLLSEIELNYDVLLDVRVISAERWQYYADIKAGLYQNITRDAVPIRMYKKRINSLSRAG
ncbi:MAG: nucleotidyltransferase domain-containing protein [Anaerolineales bacterium]|nr:nucleotidyltransferase domain-containing protein [Anaerolineales bacterium]